MEEFNLKYKIFKKNFFIKERLTRDEKNHTNLEESCFGISQFMDISEEDFQKGYLILNKSDLPEKTENYFNSTIEKEGAISIENEEYEDEEDEDDKKKEGNKQLRFLQTRPKIPREWDWRLQGAVNPVMNQGSCGGCWAFSAISNLEGVYFKKYKVLKKFSEQQLLDCDPYNSGCSGGIMHNAFEYLKSNGVAQYSYYPFQQYRGYCRYQQSSGLPVVTGYQFAGTTSENKIRKMLYMVGPLAITINANLLQFYSGGILDVPYSQCPYAPSHGVTLVGFGTTAYGKKYWIVRNTWGVYWGESGYFRIARDKGLCGLNMYVITALVN
jgi:hypothetical protein